MVYNNKLNRHLAEQLRNNIEKYIKNTPMSYDVGESNVGNANKELIDDENIGKKKLELEEREDLPHNELSGGSLGSVGGFALGTFRDSGFGSVKGAGLEGGNWLKNLGKGLKTVVKTVAGPASAVLGLVPLPQAQLASQGLGVLSNIVGNGKKGVKKEKDLLLKRTQEGGRRRKAKATNAKSEELASEKDIGEFKNIGAGKKRGRPSKMKGGSADLAEPYNMVNSKGITGKGKEKRIIGGKKLTPQANMHSSSMAGQGKSKTRNEIVKEIMEERGVNMIEASKIVKSEELYKKK